MKIVKLKNTSNESIEVVKSDGSSIKLNPGVEIKDVDISNVSEIRKKASILYNLNEG